MSIERSRIESLEAAARMRPAGPKTAAEMTDEELLLSLGFPPGYDPTDEELEAIAYPNGRPVPAAGHT